MDHSKVVFLGSNRVWRIYYGGKLLDEFYGAAVGEDGNFPEDWLASTTRAVNRENQQSENEGLSIIVGDDEMAGLSFVDFLRSDPQATLGENEYDESEGVGVLCKFLDSAVRLPIQSHPDRDFAKKHYNSNHGKAEAWIILDTREIDGEKPCLLMGFKPGVTPQALADAVEKQNIPAIENMMHKVEVNAGDMFFIPGRFPHTIGPGVFLLEIQEPTDWVVLLERFFGDIKMSDAEIWGPLSPQVGLECFDCENVFDLAEMLNHVKLQPTELQRDNGGVLSKVIDAQRTGCFEIRKLELTGEFSLLGGGYVGIVTKGELEIIDASNRTYNTTKGQSFFVPILAKEVTYKAIRCPTEIYLARKV